MNALSRFAIVPSACALIVAAWTPLARAAEPDGKFEATAQAEVVPADSKVEMVWDEGEFTEGPTPAADGAILFSDIGDRIMRFDTATGRTAVYRAPSGKSNGLEFNAAGLLVACEGAGPGGKRRISVTDKLGRVKTLADRYDNKRYNSPNDLAISSKGEVYFTDPRYVGEDPRELDFEGVFVVDPKGRVRVATRDVEKPNGIIVTSDARTVYVSDNNNKPDGKHQLVAFAVQPDGTLADKGILFDFGPNKRGIDGMTLDAEGNIYAAAGRGELAGIYVFSPQGKPLAFIPTPGDPTNCTFGIGRQSTTLFITAATRQPGADGARPPYALYRIALVKAGFHPFFKEKP